MQPAALLTGAEKVVGVRPYTLFLHSLFGFVCDNSPRVVVSTTAYGTRLAH